jgi:hypothetical protein
MGHGLGRGQWELNADVLYCIGELNGCGGVAAATVAAAAASTAAITGDWEGGTGRGRHEGSGRGAGVGGRYPIPSSPSFPSAVLS